MWLHLSFHHVTDKLLAPGANAEASQYEYGEIGPDE
jgi:hypothetical protein